MSMICNLAPMPIFHIKIELASGKVLAEFREIADRELEEYYTETYANAISVFGDQLVDFDLKQISVQSKEAKWLREYKMLLEKGGLQVQSHYRPFNLKAAA